MDGFDVTPVGRYRPPAYIALTVDVDIEIMDDIEDYIEELKKFLILMGYNSIDHFIEYKSSVVKGLLQFGGSFASSLGETLHQADLTNSVKILRYWAPECEQHSLLWKMFQAKLKAEGKTPS